ncbi:S-methyl-5'-thioinosine phosphorylase [BD1-7 clade bacterium]|uniref:Probable 6-oxopurine nucleoside phosphorylase n=1 Tax=BD1-7 clade bacterium TaxID=2029982 RepID=A0A5S9NT23_9GAMM|nr:S-methyl-5'-thioinosine phosphorylase [BD1-7 clade bacterium]CAA0093808.1 S-methyl-5'-thioinosine phosphorylase [BD1-7 clade bacterium]
MLGIIGGTGLTRLAELQILAEQFVQTPYGEPSSNILTGELNGETLLFIARHGFEHTLAPHLVNYRANIWALKSLGVEEIVAVNAVGGIADDCSTGDLCIPDQIIDYTYDREFTFCDGPGVQLQHIEFTEPYTSSLRSSLTAAAASAGISVKDGGVYGAMQGPRLETAAEIRRMKRDGCDLVGMTGMPEAALACELELNYASICMVVNKAAGLSDEPITLDDILAATEQTVVHAKQILVSLCDARRS